MQQEADISDKKGQNNRVKVAIRVRPFIQRQKILGDNSCIQLVSNTQIILGKQKLFKFDRVFDESSPQEQVYQTCVHNLVLQCFEGYNAAILAYGQTGSGKTYTMGTSSTRKIAYEQVGILPRVIANIFSQVQRNLDHYRYSVKATFLEIYNQHIIDLLNQDHSAKALKQNNMIAIRQEKDGSVSIYGANEEQVQTEGQMLQLLDKGSYHRTTSTTLMNQASSRSHAIFTITIQRNSIDFKHQMGIDQNYVTSKFVFVDLAGSQRIKKTGATGTTLKEGININLGLLELGNVISSLAVEKKQAKYINYRNSKLTRILQDSLGGNSNTYMIACVSPAESNYEQSLNTIKYASKAMNIKNKPVINRDPQQAQILKLKGLISALQKQNYELKKQFAQRGIDVSKYVSSLQQRSQNLTFFTQGEQISRLKTRNQILQKKCQKLLIQTKQQTKKSNELQIQLYETRRTKNILEIKFQKLLKGQQITQDDAEYTPFIQNYLNKVQFLQSQIHQKQKIISQLQIQYSKLYEASQRDAKILSKKNEKMFSLQRKIKLLQRKVNEAHSQIIEARSARNTVSQQISLDGPQQNRRLTINQDIDQSCIDQLESEVQLQQDSQFISQISQHETQNEKLHTEIKNIQKTIQDRQAFYNDITQQQIKLQYKLIDQMKQQYHQKIHQLEKQRQKILSRKDNTRNQEKNVAKMDNLQTQLRQLKKKAKQQVQLEKQVTLQSNKLKNLGQQINSFRLQKIQLTRKMKEEKDKFNKFRNKRIKQLFDVKKENAKKQGQLRKLKNQNKKIAQQALKKKEQIKRIKKANETLKQLVKPKKMIRGSMGNVQQVGRLTQRNPVSSMLFIKGNSRKQIQSPVYTQNDFDEIINESIKAILMQIDRQFQGQKITSKCEQIDKQIQQLQQQRSALIIKKQRLQIKNQTKDCMGEEIHNYKDLEKQQEQRTLLQQYTVKLNQIQQRLTNLDEQLEFKSQRYQNLMISSQNNYFNFETQIIYNKKYQSIQSFRYIGTSLYRSINRLLMQNLNLNEQTQRLNCQNNRMSQQISKLKEQAFNMNLECQQRIEQVREQYMELKYQLQIEMQSKNNNLGDLDNYSIIGNQTNKYYQPYTNFEKTQQQMKKKYQKKIQELQKNNITMLKQLQVQRKRCQVVTEKYNNLKSLLNKDKFIGITVKEEDTHYTSLNSYNYLNNNNNQNYRDKRQESYVKQPQQNHRNQNQQTHSSEECFTEHKQKQNREVLEGKKKKIQYYNDNPDKRNSLQFRDLQFNKNNWELAAQITAAHKSAILSLAAYQNILVSTASKSVAVWDLTSSELIHQISGGVNSSFVKSVVLSPDRNVMFTTNDRNINVWDLRTFKNQLVLKGHKDQIRILHINQDKLFSAGKGTVNGGSLLIWDLRSNLPSENVIQKQKNQDIFSMTSQDGVLYYGTRDHFVRRMRIQNNQTLLAFQPPHMDTVTGLATLGDYLISGSKDKNLRLWYLQSSMYNLKSTVHSCNQYITYVQSDDYLPLFYASDRLGQIKIGTIVNQKIQFVGGILAHSQQINSICKLNATPRRGMFATGSADKSIKIWRPNAQTLQHILNDF